ncbi:hypothetical protein E4U28_000601 [Claviceps purpurea]|nr:hypothetical protein E4U28_000601 [Claviceps purpurea]
MVALLNGKGNDHGYRAAVAAPADLPFLILESPTTVDDVPAARNLKSYKLKAIGAKLEPQYDGFVLNTNAGPTVSCQGEQRPYRLQLEQVALEQSAASCAFPAHVNKAAVTRAMADTHGIWGRR